MCPIRPCLVLVLIVSLLLTCVSALAEDVRTINAKSGDVIELKEHTTPYTNVTVSVSSTMTAPVIGGRYGSSINNIFIPNASQMSLTASPVISLYVNGIVTDTTFSNIKAGNVSGDTGTLILSDIPEGDYDISIYGESKGSIVTLTVAASQNTTSDASGLYSVNASSRGLPAGTYTVTANGVHIADVYLTARSAPSYNVSTVVLGQNFGLEQA
jgi:hypothetical protein